MKKTLTLFVGWLGVFGGVFWGAGGLFVFLVWGFFFQCSLNNWVGVSLNFGIESHVFHWIGSWGIWDHSPLMIFSVHYLTLVSTCGWCPGPKAINSGTQHFGCCFVKYMCSARSQLCQTPSKICISSCIDTSIANKVSLAASPVLLSCKPEEFSKVLDVWF